MEPIGRIYSWISLSQEAPVSVALCFECLFSHVYFSACLLHSAASSSARFLVNPLL